MLCSPWTMQNVKQKSACVCLYLEFVNPFYYTSLSNAVKYDLAQLRRSYSQEVQFLSVVGLVGRCLMSDSVARVSRDGLLKILVKIMIFLNLKISQNLKLKKKINMK